MRVVKAVLGTLALVALLAGGAAAQTGQVRGEVRDAQGNPFMDVVVMLSNEDMGQKFETKTDKNGLWTQLGMRSGTWTIQYKVKEQIVYQERIKLTVGGEERLHVNFKEIMAQRGAEQDAARKQQEEEQKKFTSLKEHFEAGRAVLDQGKNMKAELPRAPADQKQAVSENIANLLNRAITEFQQAQQMAGEKDPNLHLILANLGEAYDAAGRYDESVTAYQAAIEKKPTEAGYYVNLSSAQAKAGKVPEATATCDKVAAMEPTNAAMCYRNLGIVYYNAAKLRDAVGPLRKACELDPPNPDQWYLLAASLVNMMEYKKEGDKMVPIVQPGTAEAYQKYLELAPTGRFAADAKAGLEMLQSLGVGIPTKVTTTKKKKG
jgi:tetratricopeptide (TPR) repeat protein